MCVQVVTLPHGERTTTDDFNMCHVNICPWGGCSSLCVAGTVLGSPSEDGYESTVGYSK